MMKNKKLKTLNNQSGLTLFVAIVVTATLLLIATSLVVLAVKQAFIANAGKESQYAFYAADSGIECALYWDVKDETGVFSASTGATPFVCSGSNVQIISKNINAGEAVTVFEFDVYPGPLHAIVTINKGVSSTVIESRGYNTGDASNPRRVERAVRATYTY